MASNKTSKAFDSDNSIRMWGNHYNGEIYIHIQQKPNSTQKKRECYIWLSPLQLEHLRKKLELAFKNPENVQPECITIRSGGEFQLELVRTEPNEHTFQLRLVITEDNTIFSSLSITTFQSFLNCVTKMCGVAKEMQSMKLK